ncbi:MAG: hypothetical protein KAI66_16425 [Lentisphaeria bacterium]|nr:hypothetical protein [Lentisphaeria bacterium]
MRIHRTFAFLLLVTLSLAAAEPFTFKTTFDDPTLACWRFRSLEGEISEGKMLLRSTGTQNGYALPRRMPFRSTVAVEATIRVRKRLLKKGWNFGGVTIFQDESNFWMLALVEGPNGRHSVDFIECHAGIWQAQNAQDTMLESTGKMQVDWQSERAYRLRLEIRDGTISGTILDAAGASQLATASFAFGKTPAVRSGMPAIIVRGGEVEIDDFTVHMESRPVSKVPGLRIEDGPAGRVAVLDDALPGHDRKGVARLAADLRKASFGVTSLTAGQFCLDGVLSKETFDVLVVPRCDSFPAAGAEPLATFGREGGHILFLGGPFLDNALREVNGTWFDTKGLTSARNSVKPAFIPFEINARLDLAKWHRATGDSDGAATLAVTQNGPNDTPAIRWHADNFRRWEGHLSPPFPRLFGEGHDLFTFLVKGDGNTPLIAVEIQEEDGSRWIATAKVAAKWQRVGLALADFHYWVDSPTKKSRGGANDGLNAAGARRVNFGLSSTHTSFVLSGPHTLWITDVGSATNPFPADDLSPKHLPTSLESIYPRYKVFPVAKADRLEGIQQLSLDAGWGDPDLENLLCAVPRTQGRGFGRSQKWRYVPLALAKRKGNARDFGAPEWLLLNCAMPFDGAVFAGFGYGNSAMLSNVHTRRRIVQLARFLCRGAMFTEAGTEHFAYWPGEVVRLGAQVLSFAHTGQNVSVTLIIRSGAKTLWEEEVEIALDASGLGVCSFKWTPSTTPAVYQIKVTLSGGKPGDAFSDSVSHEFAVLDPAPAPKSSFITAHDGDFWLEGAKWYPVGINYWPLYVSGMDHGDYWGGAFRDTYYAPELVEQDLAHLQDLGINMVSIQSPAVEQCRNLLDFSRRCANHGIRINLYCGLASPLAFQETKLKDFLETARIPGNPTIFAYDTIWEPGNHVFKDDAKRALWDDHWRAWINERYGSIENAERDWHFKARRDDQGRVISPRTTYFREDGDWRGMMAAYRRFMDNLTSLLWGRANRRLRELDPNHLVSFRQGNTLPHDFALTGPVKHLDFICPEGYAVPHSDTGEAAIGFLTRYVDFTTNGQPIIWSEFGKSVWNRQTMEPSAKAIEMVGAYHARFYRTGLAAGANGTAPWWWVGGYRVGERSDFGIVGPDGTERPAALLVREYADKYKAPRSRPASTVWFDYDRDAHAGGYCRAAFHEGAKAYATAAANGQMLGIRTRGTGTNSVNTPLLAVGNVPCNGRNPPKFLDGEFNHLQILDASSTWVEAVDDTTITVRPGTPVRARISVGNLQEATWLPPAATAGKPGGVTLSSTQDSQLSVELPLSTSTPRFADADFGEVTLAAKIRTPTVFELRLQAKGRTPFGEARTFTITPASNDQP